MTDTTPFQWPQAALLDNPTDASLVMGANTAGDTAPGWWTFVKFYEYLKEKFGLADVAGLEDALAAKQSADLKGEANGYASLDDDGKVPTSELPAAISLNAVTLATFNNTSPSEGEFWFDGTNLKFQVGGVTKTVTLT